MAPGTELAKVEQRIPVNGAKVTDKYSQFSSTQVLDTSASPEPAREQLKDAICEWLGTVSSDIEVCQRYLSTRSGTQLELQEAKKLRDILRRLRTELDRNLLGGSSPFAMLWPQEHSGLLGETEDLSRRWEETIDSVNPYCELLSFQHDNPGVGMDDLSKVRQINKEIQQDSREIIRRFASYSEELLAMVTEVKRLLSVG